MDKLDWISVAAYVVYCTKLRKDMKRRNNIDKFPRIFLSHGLKTAYGSMIDYSPCRISHHMQYDKNPYNPSSR